MFLHLGVFWFIQNTGNELRLKAGQKIRLSLLAVNRCHLSRLLRAGLRRVHVCLHLRGFKMSRQSTGKVFIYRMMSHGRVHLIQSCRTSCCNTANLRGRTAKQVQQSQDQQTLKSQLEFNEHQKHQDGHLRYFCPEAGALPPLSGSDCRGLGCIMTSCSIGSNSVTRFTKTLMITKRRKS